MKLVQCKNLVASDFQDGPITVVTSLASGFKVEEHNKGTYIVSPCPTFPYGKVVKGIDSLRKLLIIE